MQRTHALAIALALGLSLSAPFTSTAHACKCMLPTIEAARADAAALFEGRVLGIAEETAGESAGIGVHRVTLAVVRSWKGLDRNERIDVFTNAQSAACGYTFAKDASYLVYAGESEGKLRVSLCGRTRPLADAAEDLAALGAGSTPVRIEPKARVDGDAGLLRSASNDGGAGSGPSIARGLDAGVEPTRAGPQAQRRSGGCASGRGQASTTMALFGALAVGLVVRRRKR